MLIDLHSGLTQQCDRLTSRLVRGARRRPAKRCTGCQLSLASEPRRHHRQAQRADRPAAGPDLRQGQRAARRRLQEDQRDLRQRHAAARDDRRGAEEDRDPDRQRREPAGAPRRQARARRVRRGAARGAGAQRAAAAGVEMQCTLSNGTRVDCVLGCRRRPALAASIRSSRSRTITDARAGRERRSSAPPRSGSSARTCSRTSTRSQPKYIMPARPRTARSCISGRGGVRGSSSRDWTLCGERIAVLVTRARRALDRSSRWSPSRSGGRAHVPARLARAAVRRHRPGDSPPQNEPK